MAERPRIICLMTSSLDGRLHPSRYTSSPDGTYKDWGAAYERLHEQARADGWIVGRLTMAEMTNGEPHPPAVFDVPLRPVYIANREGPFAIAMDCSGKLHFEKSAIGGDHVIVILGHDVSDAHLAELAADGVSYIVARDAGMAIAPILRTLRADLGIETLMLEGGGVINGAFLEQGVVDELHLILAPALDGAPSTAIVEAGKEGLAGKVELSLIACEAIGNGAVHLHYAVEAV